MEDILKDLNAMVGVTGCFVCNDEGQVLASSLPTLFDETTLSTIGRTIAQTMAGLEAARRRKISDMDLIYEQGRLVAKNLGEGCLCILCVRHINVPLLNLRANVAVKKLSSLLKVREVEAEKAVEVKPLPIAKLRQLAQETMGETGSILFDSELAKAGLSEGASREELASVLPTVEKAAAVFIGSTKARKMVELMQALLENQRGG
ncbi:MAG: roadblock/LC7 domain-containing protein [candidate division WOR-3 bacterium]